MFARPGKGLGAATGVRPVISAFRGNEAELRKVGRRSVVAAVSGTVDTFLWRALLQSVVAGGTGVIVPVALMAANLIVGQRVRNNLSRQVRSIGFRASGRLGRDVFTRLQLMPKSFFATRPNAEVQSLVLNDVTTVRDTFCNVAERLLMNTLAIGSTLVGMTIMSPALTLVMAGPLGVLAASSAYATWKSKHFDNERQSAWSKVMEVVQDRLSPSGALTTRHFGREKHAEYMYSDSLRDHSAISLRGLDLRLRISALAENAYAAGMLFGSLLVGTRLIDGVSTATYVAFFSLSARLFVPISQMPEDVIEVQKGWNSAKRLTEVLEESNVAQQHQRGVCLEQKLSGPGIEFENVSFGYNPDQLVLEDLNVTIRPGEHVALVGRSGQGKTTMLDLMVGHYAPFTGQVRINGTDVREASRQSIVDLFAVVDQNPTFFTGTIADNLREAKPEATSDELAAACRSVSLHEDIMNMPHRYDTVINSHTGLSGGQRQRIAVAKALLKDAPVVIFDEPTASIDSETGRLLSTTFELLNRGKTVITTSHQLDKVRTADRILVLHHGRVAEQGTHEELLDSNGRYAAAWRAQYSDLDMDRATGPSTGHLSYDGLTLGRDF